MATDKSIPANLVFTRRNRFACRWRISGEWRD